jgi:hypothetical protein
LRAIADSEHTVIERSGAAVGFIVNTSRIELEGVVGSIDGNAGGSLGDLGLEIRLAAGLHVDERGEGRTAVRGAVLARAILSGVRVGRFGINTTVGDDVLESISHQTAITTLVALSSGAVNQILFRKADKLPGVEGMRAFNGASGRERPARTALALVLDASDDTLGSPIDGSGECSNVNLCDILGEGDVNLLQTLEETVELVVAQIGELVGVNGEGDIGALVELLDPLVVLLPGGVPVVEFIGGVHFVVFPHPFGELLLEMLLAAEGSADEDGKQENDD